MSDVIPKDALATIGTILPDDVDGRDAVHIAVIAAKAAHKVFAGQHVCYSEGVAYTGKENASVGIVDPYLAEPVEEGQRFWLHLYPRTVTSLKHEWEHPSIPRTDKKAIILSEARATRSREDAEKRLRDWADDKHVSYKRMLFEIEEGLNDNGTFSDGYIRLTNLDSSESIDNPEVFWNDVSLVLNKRINASLAPTYFSCSC